VMSQRARRDGLAITGNGEREWYVFHGDWGGQAYLTVPRHLVRVSRVKMVALLRDLDRIAWSSNDGEGASISIVTGKVGDLVFGGMGGGRLRNDLWVHQEFASVRRRIGKELGIQ